MFAKYKRGSKRKVSRRTVKSFGRDNVVSRVYSHAKAAHLTKEDVKDDESLFLLLSAALVIEYIGKSQIMEAPKLPGLSLNLSEDNYLIFNIRGIGAGDWNTTLQSEYVKGGGFWSTSLDAQFHKGAGDWNTTLEQEYRKGGSWAKSQPLITTDRRTVKGGKTLVAHIAEGVTIYAGPEIGLKTTISRTTKYHNLGNVTYNPDKDFYEGQIGYEDMFYKGDAGDSRTTHFAIFSDPYYSIKANFYRTIASKPEAWFTKDYEKNWPRVAAYMKTKGKPLPPNKKTLYRVMSHYAPYGDLNDPLDYATKIASSDPIAWPQGINTIVDLKGNKRQFISFYKMIFYTEQRTTVEDWYLDYVYEAMFNGGPIPLQETLWKLKEESDEGPIVLSSSKVSREPAMIYNKQ